MLYENTARWEFRGNSAADFPVVDTGTTPTGDSGMTLSLLVVG